MTIQDLVEEIDKLMAQLDQVTTQTGHVGISLHATALLKDYLTEEDPENANRLYNDPFYSYFQGASNDLHTQYPIRKMALMEALIAYKRYISPGRAS